MALTVWCMAIYLISQAKTNLSAFALKRLLGVSYPTAWLMQQKLMQTMAERDALYHLEGHVQIDDAYLGGELTGGKAGRGSRNKVPFAAAVSLDQAGHPLYIKMTPAPGFSLKAIANWAQRDLSPGWVVVLDGLACFTLSRRRVVTINPSLWADATPRIFPNSVGLTRYWAISRPALAALTMPSTLPSMGFATWSPLCIALTDASTWGLYPCICSLPPSILALAHLARFAKLSNQETICFRRNNHWS